MNADQLSNKASAIRGADRYDSAALRTRAMISGATVGGLFGMYYGFTRKKNMLAYAGAGAVVGAILSRLLMPKE